MSSIIQRGGYIQRIRHPVPPGQKWCRLPSDRLFALPPPRHFCWAYPANAGMASDPANGSITPLTSGTQFPCMMQQAKLYPAAGRPYPEY